MISPLRKFIPLLLPVIIFSSVTLPQLTFAKIFLILNHNFLFVFLFKVGVLRQELYVFFFSSHLILFSVVLDTEQNPSNSFHYFFNELSQGRSRREMGTGKVMPHHIKNSGESDWQKP